MLQITAQLIERRTAGPAQELRLAAPELVRALGPGQAVLVKAGWGLEPYLRRTFYPIAIDTETWTLRVPPGGDWGHAWLRAAPVGTQVDCLGPVGAGYVLPTGVRNLLCVGEGDAAWALLPAMAQADALGLAITLAMEGRTPRELIPVQRLPANVEYRTTLQPRPLSLRGAPSTPKQSHATEEIASPNPLAMTAQQPQPTSLRGASFAPKQSHATEEIASPNPLAMTAQHFPGEWNELLPWADTVFVAGSLPFYGQLAEAVKAARFGLTHGFGQALYPATFLCGVGACQACVADVAGSRRRVCQRGPVFDLADVAV